MFKFRVENYGIWDSLVHYLRTNGNDDLIGFKFYIFIVKYIVFLFILIGLHLKKIFSFYNPWAYYKTTNDLIRLSNY